MKRPHCLKLCAREANVPNMSGPHTQNYIYFFFLFIFPMFQNLLSDVAGEANVPKQTAPKNPCPGSYRTRYERPIPVPMALSPCYVDDGRGARRAFNLPLAPPLGSPSPAYELEHQATRYTTASLPHIMNVAKCAGVWDLQVVYVSA